MLGYATFVVCCCLLEAQTRAESPKIIIIGAGPSGIAAASRLMQNGFNNITILEAENRIGGRVYTTKFGGYWVDIGGQWVHGEDDNVAYELAWPLGVIEHSSQATAIKFFSSSGSTISDDMARELLDYFFENITEAEIPVEYTNRSTGEYYELKLNEYFDVNHPELTSDVRRSLLDTMNLLEMAEQAGDTWLDVTVNPDEVICGGDPALNWMDRGYSMILAILMKMYPIPDEELPVRNSTILNAEVSNINYDVYRGGVRVTTAKGDAYFADHAIVTASLGVLKADYETLFYPPLPAAKINAIKGLEFGSVAKIYLVYSDPWWTMTNGTFLLNLHWTKNDWKTYANDPAKSWMLSIATVTGVEHKPRLLCCWLTGPHAREMESVPESRVLEQTRELFHRFFGKAYNLTEPTAMLRSQWFTNKHFRGTWSYWSLESARSGARALDLAAPIMKNGRPLVLFAGEATHSKHPSTVHGAIDSGWREANRLMELYPDRKSKMPKISHWGEQFWQLFSDEKATLKSRLVAGRWQGLAAKRQKSRRTYTYYRSHFKSSPTASGIRLETQIHGSGPGRKRRSSSSFTIYPGLQHHTEGDLDWPQENSRRPMLPRKRR